MAIDKKILVGILLFTLLTSGVIYVEWSNNARLRIDNDKTTFYVPHEKSNWLWVVSGREYNKLMDGTSNMNRRTSEITVEYIEGDNDLTVVRTTPYIRGPVIKDTYYFRGDIDDIELFPISHTVEVLNAKGKYYKYEVRDLVYNGDSFKLDGKQTAQSFGRNMKVTWWDNYRLGWVYKQGSMYVKSQKIESDYVKFEVRLFDPKVIGSVDDTGLVLHMPFEGNANDISGNGNDGTIDGSIQVVKGAKGRAFEFDDTSAGVNLGQTLPQISNGTLVAWVKSKEDTDPRDHAIISNYDGGTLAVGEYLFYINNDDTLQALLGVNGAVSTSYPTDNRWHHVAVTFDTNDVRLYLDGVNKVNDTSFTSAIFGIAQDNWVGRDNNFPRYFNGTIDEPRIYNRSLSPAEILSLNNTGRSYYLVGKANSDYLVGKTNPTEGLLDMSGLVGRWTMDTKDGSNSVTAVDVSGNGNDGTVNGAIFTNLGRFKEAYDFSIIGNYIDVPISDSLNITGNLSISVWAKMTPSNEARQIFFRTKSSSALTGYYLGYRDADDTIRFELGNGSTQFETAKSPSGTVTDNVWHHILATYDASVETANVEIFFDGVSLGTGNNPTGGSPTINVVNIGALGAGDWWVNGTLDQIEVYNRSLSSLEVLDLYQGTKTNYITGYTVVG